MLAGKPGDWNPFAGIACVKDQEFKALGAVERCGENQAKSGEMWRVS
jgi:hypothetical protein